MLLSKANSAPQTSEMYSVEELRDRGWTRSQMKALSPDLVVPPDGFNMARRFWRRSRIELMEAQPDWQERRRKLDAEILAKYGRDQAAARAQRLKAQENIRALHAEVVAKYGGYEQSQEQRLKETANYPRQGIR
jgi:hypothetical protein